MQWLSLGHCSHVPPLLDYKSLLRAVGHTHISIHHQRMGGCVIRMGGPYLQLIIIIIGRRHPRLPGGSGSSHGRSACGGRLQPLSLGGLTRSSGLVIFTFALGDRGPDCGQFLAQQIWIQEGKAVKYTGMARYNGQ